MRRHVLSAVPSGTSILLPDSMQTKVTSTDVATSRGWGFQCTWVICSTRAVSILHHVKTQTPDIHSLCCRHIRGSEDKCTSFVSAKQSEQYATP